jgi:MFS transporter, YNFM family, putative membrane transport protein
VSFCFFVAVLYLKELMKPANFDTKSQLPPVKVLKILILLALSGHLVVSQLYLSIPLVPIISQTFNVSLIAASWIGSTFSLAYAFGFLVFGPLSDRYGRKTILVPGLIALTLITFLVGSSPSFTKLLPLRVIQGFVAATFAPTALAYATEILPGATRATGIACISTGFLLAAVMGQIYGSYVGTLYGWRWVFWGFAVTYALIALAINKQLPENRTTESQVKLVNIYINMLKLLGKPVLMQAYIIAFSLLFSLVAVFSGLTLHLASHKEIGIESLLFIRLVSIPGILLSLLSGYYIPRLGSQKVMMSGLLLAIVGLGIGATETPLIWLGIGIGVFVTGIATTIPALVNFISSTTSESKATAIAVYSFVLFVGASLGPLVAAMLYPIGWNWLRLVVVLALLIAVVMVQISKKQP